jgi:hypothetical protein
VRRLLPALVVVLALTSCSEVIDDTVNGLAATALDNGIREELQKVNPDELTPREALELL